MSIGLYIVLAPLYLKSVRKLQEKRFVFVKILAIIIPENGAKVSKIKCFQFAQQTLNKEYDDKGQQKGDCFVVESLRDEDCFSKSRTAYTVTHIFSAPNDVKKYTNLLFLDENATIEGLPDEIKNMLDQTLLHK